MGNDLSVLSAFSKATLLFRLGWATSPREDRIPPSRSLLLWPARWGLHSGGRAGAHPDAHAIPANSQVRARGRAPPSCTRVPLAQLRSVDPRAPDAVLLRAQPRRRGPPWLTLPLRAPPPPRRNPACPCARAPPSSEAASPVPASGSPAAATARPWARRGRLRVGAETAVRAARWPSPRAKPAALLGQASHRFTAESLPREPRRRPPRQRGGMSGSGAAPGPGSGSSPAACRFAHYFVLCGIDADSGLEPDELAGKAGLAGRGGAREARCGL